MVRTNDKNLSKIISEYGELKDRLEALEKKLGERIIATIDNKKITDLQEQIDEHRECLEIAAQRDKFLSVNDGLIIQEQKKMGEQIAELKEEFNEHLHGEYLLLEALRELFQRMGDNEDLSKLGYDLLEKLDSKYSNIEGYDEPTYKNPKDSEGEKKFGDWTNIYVKGVLKPLLEKTEPEKLPYIDLEGKPVVPPETIEFGGVMYGKTEDFQTDLLSIFEEPELLGVTQLCKQYIEKWRGRIK